MVMALFTEYIDIYDTTFINTVLLSFSCLIVWLILPILESRFKLITKIINNDRAKAADYLAYILIHLGSFRNYSFIKLIWNSKQYSLGEMNILICQVIGIILGLICIFVYLCASTKLGLRGMYFGDSFGFVLNKGKKITDFPFNYLDHPQYYCIAGFSFAISLFFRSPVGIFISSFNAVVLIVLGFFENIEVNKKYSKRDVSS